MATVILLGAFLAVVLFVYGVFATLFSNRMSTLSRMEKATSDEAYDHVDQGEEGDTRERFRTFFTNLGKLLPNEKLSDRVTVKLTQAAVLMKSEEFIGISMVCGILLAAVVYLFVRSPLTIIFIPIGFIIPDVVLGRKKDQRMAKLNEQLPEALGIISNGLRAGFSFAQSMNVVTSEMPAPISEEFGKVLRDNSYGKPLEDALMDLSNRTDDEDLDMFITALIIQRQVGGNLADILDTISQTIMERVRIKGEVSSLTAQGRMSGMVVSILPIAMAMILSVISPGYLDPLLTTTLGKILIAAAVVLELVGIIILNKLMVIKV